MKLLLLASLVGCIVVTAAYPWFYLVYPKDSEPVVPAEYDYSYEVVDPISGVNQGKRESASGGFTSGSHWQLQPDGSRAQANYHVAGGSGTQGVWSYKVVNPGYGSKYWWW